MWVVYAAGAALFVGITATLAKVGIRRTASNLATAVRTVVVLVCAWLMVLAVGSHAAIADLSGRTWLFLTLSGLSTGASWLCYWRAMQDGPASLVAPIDRLSILVTVGFAVLFLSERITRRAAIGLALIVVGTLVMLL